MLKLEAIFHWESGGKNTWAKGKKDSLQYLSL